MNPNFKKQALEFVIKNNCANSAPVELIEQAMEQGAKNALEFASQEIKRARIEISDKRAKNFLG